MNNFFKINVTLPSGREVKLLEIKNDLYFALHKYVLNGDIPGFYELLDGHIKETVPAFDGLSIYDKFFIYLALYAFSVKSVIELKITSIELFGQNRTHSLFDALDFMMDEYEKVPETICLKNVETKIGPADIILGMPKNLDYEGDIMPFNTLSSVYKIKHGDDEFKVSTNEDYSVLENILTLDNFTEIGRTVAQNYNIIIPLVKGQIEIPILNPATFISLAKSLYYSDMDYQFDMQYVCLRHLNMPPSDFLSMTPADSLILWLKFVKEKEEEKKQTENAKNNSNGYYL